MKKRSLFRLPTLSASLLLGVLMLSPQFPVGTPSIPASPAYSAAWKERAFVVGKSERTTLELIRTCSRPYSYFYTFDQFVERFRGTPYGAATSTMLRGYKEGMTLINFESMDCVTLIENFVALTLTCRQMDRTDGEISDAQALDMFLTQIENVRYYEGNNCKWEDRIYYFTQALEELESKGIVKDIGALAGDPFSKRIQYMSQNKRKYPGISDWNRIAQYEKRLTDAGLRWFPLNQLDRYASVAESGDIIALATSVDGLDVSHCGLVHVDEGALYFSHASSIKREMVYKQDLFDYLSNRTSITGIFVYRPQI